MIKGMFLLVIAAICISSVIYAQPELPPRASEKAAEARERALELKGKIKATEDPIERAKLNIKLAEERLAEMEVILEEQEELLKVERRMMEEALAGFEEGVKEAEREIERGRALGKDATSALEVVEKATARHIEVLQGVLDRVPEEAKGAIRHALEVSQRGRKRALENLKGMKERPPRPRERPERPRRMRERRGRSRGFGPPRGR